MRVYKLEIIPEGVLGGFNSLVIEQNTIPNVPTDSIHIEFDLQRNEQAYSNAVINLYNVNRYWHNENAQGRLANAKVVLYAGVAASPVHKHAGLLPSIYLGILNSSIAINQSMILAMPIYVGYVQNCYPDMSGRDTVLKLNCVLSRDLTASTGDNKEYYKDIGMGIQSLSIPAGAQWRPFVLAYASSVFTKTVTDKVFLIGIPSKESKLINSTKIDNMVLNSFDALAEFVKRTWNEDFNLSNTGSNIWYIGQPPESMVISSIPDNELISQPQMVGVSKIALTVPLTNRFNILQRVQLGFKTFVSWQQMNYKEADVGSNFLGNNGVRKMFAGTWKIIEIWHKGQSRNSSPESWCTTLKLVSEGDGGFTGGISTVLNALPKKE